MTNDSRHFQHETSLAPTRHKITKNTGRPMGLRDRKKQETRNALARAAAELMLEEGSEGTTIASITQRANVSSRTFHNYFPHREAAFLHFIETYVTHIAEWIDGEEPGLPPIELLRRLAHQIMTKPDSEFASIHTVATLGEHMNTQMDKESARLLVQMFSHVTEAIHRYCDGALSMLEIHLMTNAATSMIGAATEVVDDPEYTDGKSLEEILDFGFDRLGNGFGHTMDLKER